MLIHKKLAKKWIVALGEGDDRTLVQFSSRRAALEFIASRPEPALLGRVRRGSFRPQFFSPGEVEE